PSKETLICPTVAGVVYEPLLISPSEVDKSQSKEMPLVSLVNVTTFASAWYEPSEFGLLTVMFWLAAAAEVVASAVAAMAAAPVVRMLTKRLRIVSSPLWLELLVRLQEAGNNIAESSVFGQEGLGGVSHFANPRPTRVDLTYVEKGAVGILT